MEGGLVFWRECSCVAGGENAARVVAGISAAARIKKSCLVLCTNSVSVDQWRYQFTLWSTLQQEQVQRARHCFTLLCTCGIRQIQLCVNLSFALGPGPYPALPMTRANPLHAMQVTRFTSEHKEGFTAAAAVCVTTYTMIAYSGRRSEDAERVGTAMVSRRH